MSTSNDTAAGGPAADGLPVALRHAVSLLSDAQPSSQASSQAARQPEPRQAESVAQRPPVTGRPVRVQIVEDLPRVQQLLRQLVEQAGDFEITGIDDSEKDALARMAAAPPDALVVDLNLRQGSGLGLINAVRHRLPSGAVAPLIIVVTNHTMPILQAACLKAGADHFLDKSRELTQLPRVLQHTFKR